MELFSPAIPARGDTIAPPANGKIPKNAEALPATFPCRFIAREKLVVFTIPTLDTVINNAIIMTHNGRFKNTTNKSKTLPTRANKMPERSMAISSKRWESLPPIWEAIIIPTPFIANMNEYC